MSELKDYQAFTPVSRPDGMPTQELLIWQLELLAKIAELEARLVAGGL